MRDLRGNYCRSTIVHYGQLAASIDTMLNKNDTNYNEHIPRIIHYCWFGKTEKTALILKCIDSWRQLLSGFEIIEWNEDNFDIGMLLYTREAYEQKKYAFVSDYARLWVLQNYGGIYLDTDVEVLKPLDMFLTHECFFGFESDNGVAPGLIMGSRPGHPILKELMKYYEKNSFINEYGTFNTYTTVQNCTDVLVRHGLTLDSTRRQTIDGIVVYEKTVFCPDAKMRSTGNYLASTYTAHHYAASWRSEAYNRKVSNPFWRALVEGATGAGKIAARFLGQKRWDKIKNKTLRGLYNSLRGVKDK